MRSAALFPNAHQRIASATPPPPGRGGLSAGFPPKADGSSVVASPPPGAAADIFSGANAAEIGACLRGVDWSVPATLPPIDMPEHLTPGPFDAAPPRRHVDLLVAIPVILFATLAAVATGLGLGWLAANLN